MRALNLPLYKKMIHSHLYWSTDCKILFHKILMLRPFDGLCSGMNIWSDQYWGWIFSLRNTIFFQEIFLMPTSHILDRHEARQLKWGRQGSKIERPSFAIWGAGRRYMRSHAMPEETSFLERSLSLWRNSVLRHLRKALHLWTILKFSFQTLQTFLNSILRIIIKRSFPFVNSLWRFDYILSTS